MDEKELERMAKNRPRIFSCPGCSLRVSGLESECPRCKRKFGPDTKLECPFCGTLVSPYLDSCSSCQISYDDFVDSAEEQLWQKALDKIVEEIEELRTEEQVTKPTEEPGPAPAPAKAPAKAPVPPPPAEEEALCPVCGVTVSIYDSVCPVCGAEFEEEEVPEEPERPPAEEEKALCPVCETLVSYSVSVCPSCGAHFEDETGAPEEEEAPAPEQVFVVPRRVIPRPVVAKRPAGLVTTVPGTAVNGAPGRSNGVSVTNGTGRINGRGQINGSGAINGRGRINGTGAINGRGRINGVGAINGRGQTNGVHFVNGLGATNGKDLVNGTGISNGTGQGRIRGMGGRRRIPIYMHWKFIAILVVVAITVPSYLQFAHLGDEGPYSVDGDFGDWESATMFTATNVASGEDSDIAEWSVARHSDSVYLYVRMTHEVMAGTTADRLVLFIDSDNSCESGYSVAGVGADFLMELFGWNSTVHSAGLSAYDSDDDQVDWNSWVAAGTVESRISGDRLEARARMTSSLNDSAKFILSSQDQELGDCFSHPVALSGGLLVVEQAPATENVDPDILPIGPSVGVLRLRFTCEGEAGSVDQVIPTLIGVASYEQVQPFSIGVGQERIVTVRVDSSSLSPGQFVSARVTENGISSSFGQVRVIGAPTMAYVATPPSEITIDGAFADWTNRTVKDLDEVPVSNPNVDIDEVGANSTDDNSYFFVSVTGQMCSGTYIPKLCVIPSGYGNGTVIPTRKTAEDFLRVYIDSDRSDSTGRVVVLNSIAIGADYMIEITGLCCQIMSVTMSVYEDGDWIPLAVQADAAKDLRRMEIGVASSAIGGASAVDFIIETTDWSGCRDQGTDEPYSVSARALGVVSSTSSQYGTSMSYQRKIFHDGTNYWAFYYDGSNTVYKYSTNAGQTWTSGGSVFSTTGVLEASIWYDSSNSAVYAVGDDAAADATIKVQKGTVNPSGHTITWTGSDTTITTGSQSIAGKNTFICRDNNGYIWVASSNSPTNNKYQLSVYKSGSANSIASFSLSADMLATTTTYTETRGLVVPAGSGSDVWCIFAYSGEIYSKKYASGSWEATAQTVYAGTGSTTDNTLTAPPSVVVNSRGTVHVVFGNKSTASSVSKPRVCYAYNNTAATTWATYVDIDPTKPSDVGNVYPTISLDSTNNDLYVFWVRTTTGNVPQTIMGLTKSLGGSWSSLSLGTQSALTRQYLTSIYSFTSSCDVCWMWTQNTTGTIEVVFTVIPEFSDLGLPILSILIMFIILSRRAKSRKKDEASVRVH